MKRGIEVRMEDLQKTENLKTSLTEIFITIPQVTEVINSVEDGLLDLEGMSITTVKIVYGDYGHGKSQTAQIAIEKITQQGTDADRIIHLETISSFRKFLKNFGQAIRQQVSSSKQPQLITDLVNQLQFIEEADNRESSLSELITQLTEILQRLSEEEFNIVLFLDEVDKITHDQSDMTEWIDFFTTLNDARDLRIFLVLFLPQASGQKLMSADTRMHRWEQFFEMEAIYLDGKYGKDTLKGVANVLALGTLYNKKSLTENDLQFVFTAYNYRQNFLVNSAIRQTNMWSLTTSEILNQCIEADIWSKVGEFLARPGATQKFLLETQLKRILLEDKLPNFVLHIDDSDEKEVYRVEYENEALSSNGVFSHGQYKLYRRTASNEIHEYSIAVIVNASTSGAHEAEILNNVVTIAENHPVVFISLGLPQTSEADFKARFQRLSEKYIQYYPISVINVPKELFGPLILVPTDPNEQMRNLRTTIKAWGTHITGHLVELQQFISTVPTQLIHRTVRMKTYELVKELPIQAKPELVATDEAATVLAALDKDPVVTAPVQDKKQRLVDAGKFFGASLVAILGSIKSYKYQSTIEKELRRMIVTSPYRDLEHALFNILPNYLKILEDNFLVETGHRGSQKIISIKDNWEEERAINIINSKF
jgi:hypothetical protein